MRRLLVAAVAILPLVASACGNDDEETTSTASATAASADADASTSTTDAAAETLGSTESTDTGTDTDTDTDIDTGLDMGEMSEECQEIAQQFEDQFTDDSDFGDIADAMDEIKALTPDDIDDDIDTLSGVYRRMADLIEERGGDLAEAMADPEILEELESLNSPEIQEASANVEQFFTEKCGV